MENRLSEAFPPDSQDTKQRSFVAKVHEELAGIPEYRLEAIRNSIRFESELNTRQLKQMRDLHKELFPIDYDDPFYDQIASGRLKFLNCVASIKSTHG